MEMLEVTNRVTATNRPQFSVLWWTDVKKELHFEVHGGEEEIFHSPLVAQQPLLCQGLFVITKLHDHTQTHHTR